MARPRKPDDPTTALRRRNLRALVSTYESVADFCRRHVLDEGYIGQLLNGFSSFGEKSARNLQTKIGLPPGWFETDKSASSFAEPGPQLASARLVPLVSTVQAGPNDSIEIVGHMVGEDVPFYTRSERAYALKVKGDAMRPRIRNGQIIVVDPDTQHQPEDDIVIKMKSGELLVKELLICRPDEIAVVNVNDGERSTIAMADVEYVHCVVDIMRRA